MVQPIRVVISGDSKGLKAAVGQANQQLASLDKTARESSQSLANIDKGFATLTKATAAVGGLYAVTAGIRDVTRAASDLQQSSGAIDSVFKDQAGAMQAAADASVELGLSTADYGNLAVTLGSQLKNMGLEDVTGQTQSLIGVGADFAAMFGGTVPDAVGAISSALRGERDPIERYGISLTEASIQAEMASTGMSKAQATISLIMKQGGDALGQWGRESETFAVKQQQMQAELENTKAKIGEGLLPVMTLGASLAGDLAGAFGAIPGPLITAGIAIGGLVVAKKLLTVATTRATVALTAYEAKVQTATGGTSLLGVAAGGAAGKMQAIGRAAGIAAVAFIGWEQASGAANDSLRQQIATSDEIAKALEATGGSIRDLNIDLSDWAGATPLIDDQIESWKALENIFNQTGWEKGKNVLGEIFSLGKGEGTVERTASVEWLNNTKDAINAIAQSDAGRARELFEELKTAMQEAGASAKDIAEVERDLAPALEKTADAAATHTTTVQEMNKAYSDAKTAVDEVLTSVLNLTDPFFRQQNATAAYIETLQALGGGLFAAAGAIDAQTGAFNLSTEAGRAADEAAQKLTTDTFALVAAVKANGGSQEEARGKVLLARNAFVEQMTAITGNREAAEALADKYGLIPDRVDTFFAADTADAESKVDGLGAKADAVAKPRTIIFNAAPGGGWELTQQGQFNFGGLGGLRTAYPSLPDGRAARAGAERPLTTVEAKRVGKIRTKAAPPTVNVYVDGQRATARVAVDPWAPHLAGVN